MHFEFVPHSFSRFSCAHFPLLTSTRLSLSTRLFFSLNRQLGDSFLPLHWFVNRLPSWKKLQFPYVQKGGTRGTLPRISQYT